MRQETRGSEKETKTTTEAARALGCLRLLKRDELVGHETNLAPRIAKRHFCLRLPRHILSIV